MLLGYSKGKLERQKELHLATIVKDNNKCFYKYISSERKAIENLPPLLVAAGNTVAEDEERLRLSMPSSVFISQTSYP